MRSSALFVALCFFFLYTQLAVADFSQGFSAYEASSFQVALAEFRKVSRQGDARAQYMLGRMYQHGYGVVANNGVAIDYYRMAAEQGHAKAQYTLGVMHQKGLDLPILQDTVDDSIETGLGPVGAMQGMRTAATHRLGLSYSEAEKWYSLAANQGLVEAQYNLGLMYASGAGIPQNYPVAYFWWAVAEGFGNKRAAEKLGILKLRMTQNDLAEGMRLTNDWRINHR